MDWQCVGPPCSLMLGPDSSTGTSLPFFTGTIREQVGAGPGLRNQYGSRPHWLVAWCRGADLGASNLPGSQSRCRNPTAGRGRVQFPSSPWLLGRSEVLAHLWEKGIRGLQGRVGAALPLVL